MEIISSGTATCPTCGEPVESFAHTPGYVLTADHVSAWEGGPAVPIPGTERRVRVVGAQGPEWTLQPCGDQFYNLRFWVRGDDNEIIRIATSDGEDA